MTQKIKHCVGKHGLRGCLFLMAILAASAPVKADTLSFNNSGDFTNQFSRKAGSGENAFEEAASIGVSGTRGIRRSSSGAERVAYTRNSSIGTLLNSASVAIRFRYATNLTGSGGAPLSIGVSTNSNFDGSDTGSGQDDYLGVELSQRMTGSNESQLILFNGVNGVRLDTAGSGFENLEPGWYEMEISTEKSVGLFDMSVALHRLNGDGTSRSETDVVTAAISSLSNADLLGASGLYLFIGGADTLNRGVEAMDELQYSGFGVPFNIAAPSGLVATAVSPNQINLSWNDNSNNETGFKIERRQDGGSWSEVAQLPVNSTTYSDTGLALDTSYTYRVVAVGNGGNSNPSNEAIASTSGEQAPHIPENLVASAFSMSRIDLTWTDTSDNENWFRIERKAGNGQFSQLEDLAPNVESYSDNGLSANIHYTYRIRSANAAGLSSPSNEASATTPVVPVPVAPSNLRFTSTSITQVSIAWDDNSSDEQGFRVERKSGNGSFEQVAVLPVGATSYSDSDVTELGNHTYRVYAYHSNGNSAFSNPIDVSLPFLAPSDLVAQVISSSEVKLSWVDNSAVETGFRIERKSGNGSYITVVNVGKDVTSFSDLTVSPLTNYTYRITGISFTTFSEVSNTANASTPNIEPPTPPGNLAIAGQGPDYVVLGWSDQSGNEQGFRIQRRTGNGSFETLAELDSGTTTYTDNQVTELQNYVYRVVSFNGGGASTPSNEVVTQIEFVHPANLVALAVSNTQIDLTWNDNSTAESGYRVDRKAGDGEFEAIATLGIGSNSYSDTGLKGLSSFTYRVVGLGNGLESLPTNEASAITASDPVPGSPSNLVANLVDLTYISLSWSDQSIDEAGFLIQRKLGDGGWSDYIQLPSNTTSFQDYAVGELETFAYRVIAFNDSGKSSPSNIASRPFPFHAPENLIAVGSAETRIDLTWVDGSLVETGYRVERKSGNGAFVELATVEQGISAYVDTGVTPNTVYVYRVVGVFDGGESSPTNEASAAAGIDATSPAAPTGLAANTIAYDQIHLTWTDNSVIESGFRIERKEADADTFAFIGSTSAGATSYTDKHLKPETNYTYRIASFVNGAKSSEPSGEASATTSMIPIPVAPDNLKVTSQAFGIVSLVWNDNAEVESGYKIQRKSNGGPYEDLATVNRNVTYFNDTTVSELESYVYRVLGYNSRSDSGFSNEVEAVIPFAAPQLLIGSALAFDQIELSWTDVSSVETGYRVERKGDQGQFEVIANLAENLSGYLDQPVVPNSTYIYRVFAVREGIDSLPSNLVNVTTPNIPFPDAPSNIQVAALSETSLAVSWKDNSSSEDGFRIYRKDTTTQVWVEIGSVVADVNLFVDDTVFPGLNYSYRITAYNAGGEAEPAEGELRIPIPGRLINISTRGLVEQGDNVMIGSFIIRGDSPKTVLIRGIGPSIASLLVDAPVLADPEITLVSGSDLDLPIAYNDDWKDTDEAGIIATNLPLAFDSESALIIQLQPGTYSAILSGVDQGTGFGMIEVYELDYVDNVRMINISTRGYVQQDDKRMIGGFVIRGDTPARVFIRATGPSLSSAIENRLEDPTLQLYAGSAMIDSNDNWRDSENIDDIIASDIPPSNDKEASIVATLNPGRYTAIVGGAGNSSGYSLLEIFYYPE